MRETKKDILDLEAAEATLSSTFYEERGCVEDLVAALELQAKAERANREAELKELRRIVACMDPTKAPLTADGVTELGFGHPPRGRWFVVQSAEETVAFTKYPGAAIVLRDVTRFIHANADSVSPSGATHE